MTQMSAQLRVWERGIGSLFGDEELEVMRDTLKNAESLAGWGPVNRKFEDEFAKYCGVKHAITVTSCTGALTLATRVLRLRKGDEVACTPQTFVATVLEAASRGVAFKFADIDPSTLNIDPETIENKITAKTRAILLVHYGGNPADMDPILEIAHAHNIAVIEDAAHAPGAEYKGTKVGAMGDFTCFSFHSLKNMTTLGEGGMLTTNNDKYAEEARRLKSMGMIGETQERAVKAIGKHPKPDPPLHDHAAGAYDYDWTGIDEYGTNFRLTEVQAAVGLVQLKKLDTFNKMRLEVARGYSEGLSEIKGIGVPEDRRDCLNVYHLYPCFLNQKEVSVDHNKFLQYLHYEKGVQIILRYFPVHLSTYMRYHGHMFGECPVCERVWFEEQINLPIDPTKTEEDIDCVVSSFKDAMRKMGGR